MKTMDDAAAAKRVEEIRVTVECLLENVEACNALAFLELLETEII